MTYEYECTTGGVFRFTVPGENRTVELFRGSKIIVAEKLTGSYLKLLRLVREIPAPEAEKPAPKKPAPKKATPKAKVADKITAVTETPEAKTDTVEVETKDEVVEVVEKPAKPAPKKRASRKKKEA